MNCIKRVFLLLVVCFGVMMSYAQQAPFGVKGTVVDVESYQPLAGVTVTIANSQLGTTTNDKGEFFIPLPSDKSAEYLIRATLMGYDAQEMNFTLQSSDTEFVSFALKNADAVIEEVVVTRRREKFTELALLEERKKSNLMVESIGAQELSRKGVSDARAALTKMAGVSRQEGVRNVLVRGLGDRYNSTSLNGLPLPSENPLYKNVSLDFFGTDVIQNINVNKTLNPGISGDVAGANIDIFTKEATGNSLEIGLSGGGNSQTIGQDNFRRINGTNWFGTLPAGSKPPITDFSQHAFQNSWTPTPIKNLINSGIKLSANKRFLVNNNPLSIFFTAGMESKYRYYEGKFQGANNEGALFLDKDYTSNEYNVSQSGMLNARYTWNNSSVSFNSLYIHDQTQTIWDMFGIGENELEGDKEMNRRQQVNDNHLFVNQILSKLSLSEKLTADLGLGFNYTIGNEPDRRNNKLLFRDNKLAFHTSSANSNERFYSYMNEKGVTAKAILSYKLGDNTDFERKIDFGYNGNIVRRDFRAVIYNFKLIPPYPETADMNGLDNFFTQENVGNKFQIETGRGKNNADPFYYLGNKDVHSALGNLTYQFDEKFTALVGLRFDKIKQTVEYNTNIGNSDVSGPSIIDKNYFLPSLNLKYSLTEKMILRASGSQSYILPQFIEIAPMLYNGQNITTQGNSNLVPSEVINADLKWELYPGAGDLVAVGLFYKNIKNPISRIQTFSSGNPFTFANTGSQATVLGAELEVKKDLLRTAGEFGENVLSAGLNFSYLHSKQKLDYTFARFLKAEDKLEGASPILVNADLSYKAYFKNFDLQPTLVLNYFSDRIYALGTNGYENVMEKGYPTLDFVMNGTISRKFGVNIKAENILNPERQYNRGFVNGAPSIIVESFKRGVDFSAGVSYKF
ncbi:TonB-dependent receptor domain-containing protein [Sphingobacterium sp. BS-2]|uniref:TonB-dependent receptor n=1 Tax=Sphingobacterium sp. BS-2 TaxID=3377129 RepID=UPI0038FC3F78